MSDSSRPTGPTLPRVHLTVASTGHRHVDGEVALWATREAREIVGALVDRTKEPEAERVTARPAVVLLSQLADGADQIFAEAALDAGAGLHALFPLAFARYAASLPEDARAGLERLAARADRRWTAPGTAEGAGPGYHLTGMVMLAQCDLLLALWDGEPARGPGGTAAIVDEAVRQGVPVIHIDPGGEPTRVLWSGFDHVGAERLETADAPSRPCDRATLDDLAAMWLGPPQDAEQRDGLETFLREREKRIRLRIEYPLLLAIAGIRSLRRGHVAARPYREATRSSWSGLHRAVGEVHADAAERFAAVEEAFAWSDRLADHYAQIYRSGTILNYVAAAAAVLLALAGVPFSGAKLYLLAGELVCLTALISNTAIGNRRQWHRRWLDYRYLAEQLRAMRSLKLLGAFGPRPSAGAQAAACTPWTEWYASAVWRSLELAPAPRDAGELARLVEGIVAHELEPQVRYHEGNAHRMHLLDHRLHQAGTGLFAVCLVASLLGLVGELAHVAFVVANGLWLTVIGAALPTVGAALFGIRGQSDFAGAARRSAETARRLKRTARRMDARPMTLSLAARLAEDAAQTMAADLGEWRTTFLHRRLAIPS